MTPMTNSHLPSASRRPALELTPAPTDRLGAEKFHKKGFIAKLRERLQRRTTLDATLPQDNTAAPADSRPSAPSLELARPRGPGCPAMGTGGTAHWSPDTVGDSASTSWKQVCWLKPQPARRLGREGCSPGEAAGTRDCGHLMTLLLLRWRQVEREADSGVGAQRVQGVWFGEASGGSGAAALLLAPALPRAAHRVDPAPLPTTLKNEVTGQ